MHWPALRRIKALDSAPPACLGNSYLLRSGRAVMPGMTGMGRTSFKVVPAGKSRSRGPGARWQHHGRAGGVCVSVSLYQSAEIELRQGSRVICSSKRDLD